MRVAIITYYAVRNVGDKILTETLAYLVKRLGHKVGIVDIQGRYPYRFCGGFCGALERKLVQFWKAERDSEQGLRDYFEKKLRNCDIVVFGGGEIISSESPRVSLAIRIITELSEKNKVPVFFNAIGIRNYPPCEEVGKDLKVALAARSVKSISVRENRERFIRSYMPDNPSIVTWTCDTAVWSQAAYGLPMHSLRSKMKSIGVNIITPKIFSRRGVLAETVIDFYSRLTLELIECGFEVTLFTNGVSDEITAMKEIRDRVGSVMAVEEWQSPLSFMRMLNAFDGVISSHLHTSICSFSLGIPTVALTWNDKIDYFYGSICESKFCVDLSSVGVDDVVSLMKKWPNMYKSIDKMNYCSSIFKTPFFSCLKNRSVSLNLMDQHCPGHLA